MGRDKALLPWGGATLLDHTLDRLRAVAGEVRILCGPDRRYVGRGAEVDVDLRTDAGPLAGLEAGLLRLLRLRAGLGLFLGVDLPFVPATLLRGLVELAPGFDAVVPVCAGMPQPLCAVYTNACLPWVQSRLDGGERQMTSFWPDVRVRVVPKAELEAYGDVTSMFLNLNTPEDYERVRPR